jgi:hypothetical protein
VKVLQKKSWVYYLISLSYMHTLDKTGTTFIHSSLWGVQFRNSATAAPVFQCMYTKWRWRQYISLKQELHCKICVLTRLHHPPLPCPYRTLCRVRRWKSNNTSRIINTSFFILFLILFIKYFICSERVIKALLC